MIGEKLKAVTVTLNPALDLTGSLELLMPGKVNLLETGTLHPAGKGINVAKILAELGAEVTATGLLGSDNQQAFIRLLASLKIKDEFIRVAGNTRINVKIIEKSGRVSDLNFPGITVKESDIKAFEQILFTLAQSHDLFVIAGSLPPGLDRDRLTHWIKTLQNKGKKVFFDSSNQALIAGIKAAPFLIKPNNEELSAITGTFLKNKKEIITAAEKLQQQGCQNIIVSCGEDGALWIDQTGISEAKPPKMEVVSTVGAGDSLVAGLCWAELNKWDKDKAISFSCALAALAVTQTGVGISNKTLLESIQKKITVQSF